MTESGLGPDALRAGLDHLVAEGTLPAPWRNKVFGRPFPEPLPRWDDQAASGTDLWATEHETREGIIGFYRRVWEHSDATINALPIDADGHVQWWPRPNVKLFNILVHILTETNRHAGHADILREQLDGAIGTGPQSTALAGFDTAYWKTYYAKIEQAAKAADPAGP